MPKKVKKEYLEKIIGFFCHYGLIILGFAMVASTVIYGFWYEYSRINALLTQVNQLESRLASTTESIEGKIKDTENLLIRELQLGEKNVTAIKDKLGDFESEVGAISGTVSTLEKLSKTDPELLQKYSKVFFLNEHYTPTQLTDIPVENRYFEDRDHQIHTKVWPYLKGMLEEARTDNEEIFVYSSYRSFETQEALKGRYAVTYGAGTANQFSADQGYSEHQLGTTVDLITTGIDGTLPGFENTSAYRWLLENAHRYGFILSYPEGNGFYVFEPWHWRFVGIKLATNLHNTNRNFYDLDQREIDGYLASFYDE